MLIYGVHSVSAAIAKGFPVQKIYLLTQGDAKRREEVVRQCRGKSAPRVERFADKKAYEKCLDRLGVKRGELEQTQGIAAELSSFPYASVEQIIAAAAEEEHPLVLFLDSVTDPQNLGAILRSAAFFGVTGIVIPDRRSAPVTATAIKVSAGGFTEVAVAEVSNLVQAMKAFKDAGFWIYGLSEHATERLTDLEFTGPVGLVIGNEEKGIRDLVLKSCDFRATLPASHEFVSLNAATAAAVSLAVVRFR